METKYDSPYLDIIDEIISTPPKAPNEISLDFTNDENDETNENNNIEPPSIIDIYDFLLLFLSKLCRKLYLPDGNKTAKINLSLMTPDNILDINKYYNSIGYELILDILPMENDIIEEMQNGRFDKIQITPYTRLKELYYCISSNNKIYKISFDFYNKH